MEVAGDGGVGAVGCADDVVEGLLELLERRASLCEGDRLVAELSWGMEENHFVDERLTEEGAVEV